MKRRYIITAVVLAASIASAADWTEWVTTGTGDWFNASNWDLRVPASNDNHWVRNDGTANIASAGAVCNEFQLGYDSNGGGTVNVSGAGTLDIGSYTYVCRNGDPEDISTLNITDGGKVTSPGGVWMSYYNGGGTGVVNVDGSGSSWTITNTFEIGRFGSTTINIKNGGVVTHTGSSIRTAYDESSVSTLNITSGGQFIHSGSDFVVGQGGAGAVLIDGSGSSLLCSSNHLFFGNYGDGTMEVTGGATVTAGQRSLIGFRTESGVVTVSGTGSVFNANELDLGWDFGSSGVLNISAGGLVTCQSVYMSSNATLAIVRMGGDGMLAVSGDGSADIDSFLDLVDGDDNIEFWTGAVWANLTNATLGTDASLVYHTSGDLNGYTVLTAFDNEVAFDKISIVIDGTDTIIGWDGTLGVSYALQSITDLTALPPWVDVQTNISGLTGPMSATSTTTAAESFYRVIIEE